MTIRYHFRNGIEALRPCGYEQYFVSRRVTENVIDVEGSIEFIEPWPANIRPSGDACIQKQAEFRHLIRSMFPEVFQKRRLFFDNDHNCILYCRSLHQLILIYKDAKLGKMFHGKCVKNV